VVRGTVVNFVVVVVMVVGRGECRSREREHAAEEEQLLHSRRMARMGIRRV
jgi:hypothetical protein